MATRPRARGHRCSPGTAKPAPCPATPAAATATAATATATGRPAAGTAAAAAGGAGNTGARRRSEEHTSELQSLMRITYAVFCLKTKTQTTIRLHTVL